MCDENNRDILCPEQRAQLAPSSVEGKVEELAWLLSDLKCTRLIVESRGGNLAPHDAAVKDVLTRGEALSGSAALAAEEGAVDRLLKEVRELRAAIDRTAAIWLFMPKDSP